MAEIWKELGFIEEPGFAPASPSMKTKNDRGFFEENDDFFGIPASNVKAEPVGFDELSYDSYSSPHLGGDDNLVISSGETGREASLSTFAEVPSSGASLAGTLSNTASPSAPWDEEDPILAAAVAAAAAAAGAAAAPSVVPSGPAGSTVLGGSASALSIKAESALYVQQQQQQAPKTKGKAGRKPSAATVAAAAAAAAASASPAAAAVAMAIPSTHHHPSIPLAASPAAASAGRTPLKEAKAAAKKAKIDLDLSAASAAMSGTPARETSRSFAGSVGARSSGTSPAGGDGSSAQRQRGRKRTIAGAADEDEEDEEIKRLKRMERNRESAQRSRDERKAYVENLEIRVRQLEAERDAFSRRVYALEAENVRLRSLVREPVPRQMPVKAMGVLCMMILSVGVLTSVPGSGNQSPFSGSGLVPATALLEGGVTASAPAVPGATAGAATSMDLVALDGADHTRLAERGGPGGTSAGGSGVGMDHQDSDREQGGTTGAPGVAPAHRMGGRALLGVADGGKAPQPFPTQFLLSDGTYVWCDKARSISVDASAPKTVGKNPTIQIVVPASSVMSQVVSTYDMDVDGESSDDAMDPADSALVPSPSSSSSSSSSSGATGTTTTSSSPSSSSSGPAVIPVHPGGLIEHHPPGTLSPDRALAPGAMTMGQGSPLGTKGRTLQGPLGSRRFNPIRERDSAKDMVKISCFDYNVTQLSNSRDQNNDD